MKGGLWKPGCCWMIRSLPAGETMVGWVGVGPWPGIRPGWVESELGVPDGKLELRAADLQAKPKRAWLAGWDVINTRSAWLGGPELNCHVPGSSRSPSGFWEEDRLQKCLARA